MKYILYTTIYISMIACKATSSSTNIVRDLKFNRDSIERVNFNMLKEFAVCTCIYAVPENKEAEHFDVSRTIYANILEYRGVDTLTILASEMASSIKPETYVDYKDKKAIFLSCSHWANRPNIDSLMRMYAKTAANVWYARYKMER